MTRRKMLLLMTAGTTALGGAALVSFADYNAVFADDDEDESQEALIKLLDASKINLQQGLAASEQQGQPISAKFEVDKGKLQLSVYTVKDGKFFEVLINYVTGKVLRFEPITEGEDLTAARAQSVAMTGAKMSLQAAVEKTVSESANIRAINVVPSMKDGYPVASIDILNYNQFKAIQQPLD